MPTPPSDAASRLYDADTFGPDQPCFGCAPSHPIGFRLRFEEAGDEVVTRFVPGEQYQGPPGVMHGGLVTALADEVAAWTIIGKRGRLGFTASIEVRLVAPVRIGVELTGRGRIVSENKRVVRVAVRLEQTSADALRGEFAFALLDEGGAERLLRAPLPAQWKRFCR